MGFFTTRSLATFAMTVALLAPVQAQTYTKCDPLKKTCPADLALGGTMDIDFTAGERDDFIVSGDVTYGDDGLELSVTSDNRGPYLQSKWYMMFGRVEVTMKAAPGGGVVSSFILQSDDLDEVDLEWVGSQSGLFQTNFFGKGFTGTYNRGQNFHTAEASADFHTYSIDWNAERIQWIMDGDVQRTLVPSDFPGQFPQSPMFVKFGPWAAGDPTNNPKGTVQWADGPIDFDAGPYTMYVQSITASDYSTGTSYKYTDHSGTWESIEAIDGDVNADATEASGGTVSAPSSSSSHSATSSSSSSKSESTSSKSESTSKSEPTSTKSSESSSSKPTSTDDSSSSSSTASTGATPSGGAASSTSGGSSQPTGSSQNNSADPSNDTSGDAPDNAATSGKQVAWGVSLVCAAVGMVVAL